MSAPAERLRTADHAETRTCVQDGVDHGFRPRAYEWYGRQRTSWACVWCGAVTCGDYGEADPCWRVYHHREPHRSRAGVEWPIGGTRPGGSS